LWQFLKQDGSRIRQQFRIHGHRQHGYSKSTENTEWVFPLRMFRHGFNVLAAEKPSLPI
jgi:hypothetical protein